MTVPVIPAQGNMEAGKSVWHAGCRASRVFWEISSQKNKAVSDTRRYVTFFTGLCNALTNRCVHTSNSHSERKKVKERREEERKGEERKGEERKGKKIWGTQVISTLSVISIHSTSPHFLLWTPALRSPVWNSSFNREVWGDFESESSARKWSKAGDRGLGQDSLTSLSMRSKILSVPLCLYETERRSAVLGHNQTSSLQV